MNLNEFLENFKKYKPVIVDTFENQWQLYTNEFGTKGTTHTIMFDGDSYHTASVSLTFVDLEIVEGVITFQDFQIIYLNPYYQIGYENECKSRSIDINGTKNVWEWGDYIPNIYATFERFLNAMHKYAEQIYDNEKVYYRDTQEKPYKVVFTIEVEYDIDAENMNQALEVATDNLKNDMCFYFNDRSKVIKQAVFEDIDNLNEQ